MASSVLQKVEVSLPADALDYLDEQARLRGVTPAEVLLSAIGTDKFVRDKAAAGSEIVVRENGKSSRVVF